MPPRDGAYSQIPVCRPSEWLTYLEELLRQPEVELLRRRLRVAGTSTVLAAARLWAAAADRTTGRNVAIAHETIAEEIGYAPATVKRICRFLTRLGVLVEVARGANWLTLEQLEQARAQGAEGQRAAASTRALTIPRSVDRTPLPGLENVSSSSYVSKNSPTRPRSRAREAAAPRRPLRKNGNATCEARPRPLQAQELAGKLAARLPAVHRSPVRKPLPIFDTVRDATGQVRRELHYVDGLHIGHLADAIDRMKLAERGWTAQQVLDRIEAWRIDNGVPNRPVDEQRAPLAYLLWLIRSAIPEHEISPTLSAQLEREQRRAARAAAAAELADRRRRIEAERDQIEAIIATMRAQRRHPSRRRPGESHRRS